MLVSEEIVRCSIGASILLFLVVGMGRVGITGLRNLRHAVVDLARNCMRGHSRQPDETKEFASALFERNIRGTSRKFLLIATLLLSPLSLNGGRNGFAALRANHVTVDATTTAMLGLLPLNLMGLLCLASKEQPTRTSISLFHIAFFACAMQMLWSTESQYDILANNHAMVCWRLSVFMLPGRFASRSIVNFAYSFCLSIQMIHIDAQTPDPCLHKGEVTNFLQRELSYLFVSSVMPFLIDAASFRETLATAESQMSDMWRNAFAALQDAACSVTVKLDGDARIADDDMKLAGFLLMGERPLLGHRFASYVDAADLDTFEHLIEAQTESFQSLPCSINLRDSSGSKVPVQIFHTQFIDIKQRIQHLVGLVEVEKDSAIAEEDEERVTASPNLQLRRSRRPKHKLGTPMLQQRHDLESLGPQVGAPTHRTILAPLTNPDFQVTTEVIKVISLLELMRMWNLQLNRTSCCPVHSHLQDCEALVKKLKRISCQSKEEFIAGMGDHQCRHCGMVVGEREMDVEEGNCRWCEKVAHMDLKDAQQISNRKKIGNWRVHGMMRVAL
eukprot:TRINITY_DN10237_c0_g1_i15.p1 TRINITY_DN10237_c0_g1~~TRINITY_DN10237_c0_g1_i15.p1  ORF type:complete len:559 (-),score=88.48 TRINITY_DN10237_c0_g1_i15:267-1943(-)